MNRRRHGIALFVLGIILILITPYVGPRISSEAGVAYQKTNRLTASPLTEPGGKPTEMFDRSAKEEVKEAQERRTVPFDVIRWGYILGIALIVIGIFLFVFSFFRP